MSPNKMKKELFQSKKIQNDVLLSKYIVLNYFMTRIYRSTNSITFFSETWWIPARILIYSCKHWFRYKYLSFIFFLCTQIESVLLALSRELLRDYRADFDKRPLFKKGVLRMTDLREGTEVSGAISNITSFGCFVDIGVEQNALLHISQFKGFVPKIGDRINAIVGKVEVDRQRIQLRLQI